MFVTRQNSARSFAAFSNFFAVVIDTAANGSIASARRRRKDIFENEERPMKSHRKKASPQKQTTAGSVEKRDRIQGCQYAFSRATKGSIFVRVIHLSNYNTNTTTLTNKRDKVARIFDHRYIACTSDFLVRLRTTIHVLCARVSFCAQYLTDLYFRRSILKKIRKRIYTHTHV